MPLAGTAEQAPVHAMLLSDGFFLPHGEAFRRPDTSDPRRDVSARPPGALRGVIGAGIGKLLAVRKVAAGGEGVTVIPLDVITSLRLRKSADIRGWLSGQALLVTTADGAEYEFRGWMNGWQADLATALTVSGREIRVTPESIMVTPQATPEAG